MMSAVIIIGVLAALDVMLFIACAELEKREEEREKNRKE